jgi:hypothetical protein
MLYWLVRRMKARDLSYENLTPDRRQLMLDKYGSEVEISVAVRPQKQHIVPYSWLRAVYGVTERGRLVYHPINNIGNLTYISAALNDIETGLGAEPFRYDQEPWDNLERHFLANRDNDDLRLHYHSAIQNDGQDKDLLRESYEDLCDVRRKLIAHGFADWLREETPSWHLDRRIRPDKRMFTDSPFDDDLIRELKYPSELEDVLLARVEDPKFRLDKRRSGKQMALVNLRDDSKDAVLELKLLKNRIEISPKKPVGVGYMSRLTAAGSLRTISEGQWHLRVDSKQPAAAVSVLSTLLDAVLDAKP